MGIVTAVEPSERYAQRRNKTLLKLLEKSAVKGRGEPYDLDGYQLHTHPDLCDHLQSLNPHCYGGAYGVPVLANDGGVIFAVARGTSHVAFQLPDSAWEKAREAGGFDTWDLGEGWFAFQAWQTDKDILRHWCRAAHAYANRIGKGKTP
jgi:hypothetical protein